MAVRGRIIPLPTNERDDYWNGQDDDVDSGLYEDPKDDLCPRCKGTGMDRWEEDDCTTCLGEGVVLNDLPNVSRIR